MDKKWVSPWAMPLIYTSFSAGIILLLEQAYTGMNLRFFMLQAHYRSTLDFSNEALQAAEKGYIRLAESLERLGSLHAEGRPSAVDTELDTRLSNFRRRFETENER